MKSIAQRSLVGGFSLAALLLSMPSAWAQPMPPVLLDGSGGGGGGEAPDRPPGAIMFDSQEYEISPTDRNWLTTLRSNSDWDAGKAANTLGVYPPRSPGEGNGFFYTVTSIPGVSSPIPGNGRALAVEGHDETVNQQTDFYLQYGAPEDPVGTIPGDVWFQFWILLDPSPEWYVTFTHPKFIYPTKNYYPATSLADQDWLAFLGSISMVPDYQQSGGGRVYLTNYNTAAGQTSNYGASGECLSPTEQWRLGQVDTSRPLEPGTWYLVRFHANTSASAVNQGRHLWETYVREYGDQTWHLLARWRHGRDFEPGPGLGCTVNWQIDGQTHGYGHKMIRIPTTVGPTNLAGNAPGSNQRYYLKDFAIAAGTDSGGNGTDDLPSYAGY